MQEFMKVMWKMVKDMVRVKCLIKMVILMMGNGKMIFSMARELI